MPNSMTTVTSAAPTKRAPNTPRRPGRDGAGDCVDIGYLTSMVPVSPSRNCRVIARPLQAARQAACVLSGHGAPQGTLDLEPQPCWIARCVTQHPDGQRKHHDSISGDGYDAGMRTTVTLDDDVVAALRTAMRERGVSFKDALNSAVRSGLSAANPSARPYQVKPFAAEIRSGVDITKINRLLADWEDEEILRKLELGK
jgi:hypothetical protein